MSTKVPTQEERSDLIHDALFEVSGLIGLLSGLDPSTESYTFVRRGVLARAEDLVAAALDMNLGNGTPADMARHARTVTRQQPALAPRPN